MSEEISRGRSPSCPQIPLSRAIEMAKALHAKAGKASISRETAIGPLGFNSMNGAALTALAVLAQYGLIDAERGGKLMVSDLARKLIHPLSEKQEREAKAEAALKPKVFTELYQGGYGDCDETVLANHLVQQSGFTPDGARRVAAVFKANVELANLGTFSMIPESNVPTMPVAPPILTPPTTPLNIPTSKVIVDRNPQARECLRFALDEENGVELYFIGPDFGVDQIDALTDYLQVMRKQFARKASKPEKPITMDDI